MRFRIIARSYRNQQPYLLRLEDGRVVKDLLRWVGFKPAVGMTGTILHDERGRQRMKLDAIDAE